MVVFPDGRPVFPAGWPVQGDRRSADGRRDVRRSAIYADVKAANAQQSSQFGQICKACKIEYRRLTLLNKSLRFNSLLGRTGDNDRNGLFLP